MRRLGQAANPVAIVLLSLVIEALGEETRIAERPIAAEERTQWSFQPPKRNQVPGLVSPWLRNPIDSLILSELRNQGFGPTREASRATLLRRLSIDLIGLPPTPDEIEAFENDRSPLAYEKVVDRLLASPHYGIRSAQHWLDLARYADTDGFEFDQARPNAWRYRDWVVDALNRDLPYDGFVRLQIAGDEIFPDDPNAFVATGFSRCYPDMVDLNDQGLRRQNALHDITETTGLVFLGLTIGCARCHDHKADPIRQVDFYRLQAFFTPARFRDDFPLNIETLKGNKSSGTARVVDETGDAPPPTYFLRRGEFHAKGPTVEPGYPKVLSSETPKIRSMPRSSGRRRALAEWLTRPDHPLTARVMVNRLWQRHFGRGLVDTPSDFGTMGGEPSHPELLDWLANEFVKAGWSLKTVHRLIVTSATYRQSPEASSAAVLKLDPENRLLSHQSRRRLDGEAIRDAMLLCSGQLNPAMGGPGIFPDLPPELTKLSSKGAVWPLSPAVGDRNRRSLYVFVRRNLRYPFFESFDRPDTNASCPRREVTTIAPQALSMLNGQLAYVSAHALCERLIREAGDSNDARVNRAYLLTVGRAPDETELSLARSFLKADEGSLLDFCLALLNTNEFIYID